MTTIISTLSWNLLDGSYCFSLLGLWKDFGSIIKVVSQVVLTLLIPASSGIWVLSLRGPFLSNFGWSFGFSVPSLCSRWSLEPVLIGGLPPTHSVVIPPSSPFPSLPWLSVFGLLLMPSRPQALCRPCPICWEVFPSLTHADCPTL